MSGIVLIKLFFILIVLQCSVPMKEEDPLTPEEILKDALPAIDGPEFEDCGTEFKKDLR